MARGTPTHKPAIRFRVQDKDNTITSNAALGVAVGFAQKFVKIEERRLTRNGTRKLPKKRYNFAMPAKGIVRIEIESHPYWGWGVRIIGGESFGGSFLMLPDDHRGTPYDWTRVRSSGFGGPYTVDQKPTWEASWIDWKGKLREEKLNGDPLDSPRRDVLTYRGPHNRYGPNSRRRTSSPTNVGGPIVWKDGRKFARAPDINNRNGVPSTLAERQDFPIDSGRVCGAAIQRITVEGDPVNKLIIITDNLDARLGTGVVGLGFGTFHIWERTVIGDDLRNDQYDPAYPEGFTTGPGGTTNFRGGWRLIGELSPPTGFYPDRWERSRMWYFNESGTQAACMLPIQEPDEDGLYPAVVRNGSFWLSVSDPRLKASFIGRHPWTLQEATVDVAFDAQTGVGSATMTLGDVQNGKIRRTGDQSGTASWSASGDFTAQYFDANGDCFPEQWETEGSDELTQTFTRESLYTGGPWKVAVDYKGDTKVYATLDPVDGHGIHWNNTFTRLRTNPTPVGGGFFLVTYDIGSRMTVDQNETTGMKLVVGATEVDLARQEKTYVGSAENPIDGEASGSFQITNKTGDTPGGTGFYLWIPNDDASILWMDLRADLVVHSVNKTSNMDGTLTTTDFASSLFDPALQPSSGGTEIGTLVRVVKEGQIIEEYRPNVFVDRLVSAIPVHRAINAAGLVWEEVSTTFPEDAQISNPPFCNSITPTGIAVEWTTVSTVTGVSVSSSGGPVVGNPAVLDGGTEDVVVANEPSLEIMAGDDRPPVVNTTSDVVFELANAVGVDGAGNLAYSIILPSAVQSRVLAAASTYLDLPEPNYMNTISVGQDLIAVLDQITFIDPGPDDTFGTADDIELAPLGPTGRGHVQAIYVLG